MFFSGKQFGNYTLVKLLGRGSFGEVWLANRETKFVTTKVAVKLPLREQVNAETIKQEAVLWEQASGHPNVLPIIEADEYDGQILIVSEYASGGTLDDLLEKEGVLPVKKAVEMAIGILNGLEFLHSRQIIHRDIKPANILLQGDIPRLTDFGLSRTTSGNSMSMSISINGTPYYMSPEAFNRKRNQQTDIWSFGVVLFKMLSGKLPFAGNDVAELYTAVFGNPPAPIPDFVPPFLQEIILKTLAKNPLERYANAAEVREDLTNCLANLSNEQLRIHTTSANNFKAQTTDEFNLNQSSNSLSIATQTIANPNFVITRETPPEMSEMTQVSPVNKFAMPLKKRKSHKFKYLTAACVLLLSIFGTGFYIVSQRVAIPFRHGDKFGFSTWTKQVVIGAKYDLAFPFSSDRAVVAVGKKDKDGNFVGKYGYVDHAGREIIPLEYDAAETFTDKIAKVAKSVNGQKMYGFINLKGVEVIPFSFEDAHSFSEDLAAVKQNGKWGVIDAIGKEVVPFKYDWIDSFANQMAVVKLGNKYGYIDKSGNEVIAPVYDLAEKFSETCAPVQKDGKAFFIDKTGNLSLPYKYESAEKFSEGFAMVTLKGKSGFIDKNGAETVAFKYEDDHSYFSEGLAAVKINGKFGFIDARGNTVIPFKYTTASPIKSDLSLVKIQDGKEYFVGIDGTEFYEP